MAGGGGALYSIVAFILNRDSQWREGVEHCISVEFLLQYGDEGVVRSLQVSHSQLTQSPEQRYEEIRIQEKLFWKLTEYMDFFSLKHEIFDHKVRKFRLRGVRHT